MKQRIYFLSITICVCIILINSFGMERNTPPIKTPIIPLVAPSAILKQEQREASTQTGYLWDLLQISKQNLNEILDDTQLKANVLAIWAKQRQLTLNYPEELNELRNKTTDAQVLITNNIHTNSHVADDVKYCLRVICDIFDEKYKEFKEAQSLTKKQNNGPLLQVKENPTTPLIIIDPVSPHQERSDASILPTDDSEYDLSEITLDDLHLQSLLNTIGKSEKK